MTRAEFDHVERSARRLVPRALAGDDEALEAVIFETRPALLSLPGLQQKMRQTGADPQQVAQQLSAAIEDAVILWQPQRGEDFSDVVWRRLTRRLGDYFLRRCELLIAVSETGEVSSVDASAG